MALHIEHIVPVAIKLISRGKKVGIIIVHMPHKSLPCSLHSHSCYIRPSVSLQVKKAYKFGEPSNPLCSLHRLTQACCKK